MKKYKVIDHPSDTGIEVYGNDIKDLFENAASGMMDLMFEKPAKQTETYEVKVSADDRGALMIAWLSELLFISDAKHISLSRFNIDKLTDKELEAKVYGGRIRATKVQVKAATYNQLEIKKESDRWKARLIFDV